RSTDEGACDRRARRGGERRIQPRAACARRREERRPVLAAARAHARGGGYRDPHLRRGADRGRNLTTMNAELAETAERCFSACSAGSALNVVSGGAGVAGLVATMTDARQEMGKTGEGLACRELERRGYAIVARRYRQRGGELDIIARDGPTLVFVEVKARDGRAFGDAADAVTGFKRRRITRLARDYMMRQHLSDCPCRFDVVAIHFEAGAPVIELFQNAF